MTRNTLLTIALVLSISMQAQQDLMMHGFTNVFQSTYVNPAYSSGSRLHIGLPVLSSISGHHQNTVFNPGRMFSVQEGQAVLDVDRYLAGVDDLNYLGADLAMDLFSLGLTVKGHGLSLAVRQRISAQLTLPGDMLRFPFIGNGNFEEHGNVLDFSGLALDLNRYTEYGFGWNYTTDGGWHLGGRLKYLVGQQNITTSRSEMHWTTDPDTYAWSLEGNMEVQTSGIEYLLDSIDGNGTLESGRVGDYIFKGGNRGIGLDLGIGKDITDRLSVYASIVDLGRLNWKNETKTYSASSNEFSFVGIELSESILGADSAFKDSLDHAIDELLNSLESTVDTDEDQSSYTSALRTRIHANVNYRILKNEAMQGTLGLIVQADVYNRIELPSFSLMYSHAFKDRLQTSLAWTVADGDYGNLGISVSTRTGPIVIYSAMDNVFGLRLSDVNLSGAGSGTAYPSSSKNPTIHFGMNISIWKGDKVKDQKPRNG